jgi:hypothetical protein
MVKTRFYHGGFKVKFINTVVAIFMVLVASVAYANQESEYLRFFEKYQALGDKFDIAVADLYSDDAKVIAVRLMRDGTKQTFEMDGKKWKQLIADTMELSEKLEDKNSFDDVKIIDDDGIQASSASTMTAITWS